VSVRCVHWLCLLLAGATACSDDEAAKPDGSRLDTAMTVVAVADHAVSVASSLLDNSCSGMRACRYDGQCSLVDDACRAADDDACKRSLGCRDWGACHASGGRCSAANDEDCRSAWTCKNKGRCSARKGACVVDEDRDCRRSELCKYERKCTARKGRCVKG